MKKSLALALLLSTGLCADEGMWTFDNLPVEKMQAQYGFAPDAKWLEHLRLSVVRFPGGTGSFVSKDGLVLTNHHVGRGNIQQVSSKDHDYVKNGFHAATREQEIQVPGLELYTLLSMDNVTERVNLAVKKGAADKEALKAREAELGRIKQEEQDKTGLFCEPVTLYQGGEYWIYRYKKHTDVRLVFAPEQGIAAFGGDPDNFTFPRHDLDFSLFRVYENGKPYHPPHHLSWSAEGLKLGDLTFVAGHPGSTARLDTFAEMAFARDFGVANRLKSMDRLYNVMRTYAKASAEAARQVVAQIANNRNGHKAMSGWITGLGNAEAMARIQGEEKALQAKVKADPKLAYTAKSWDKIALAMQKQKALSKQLQVVNTRNSTLLGYALNLVRLPDEIQKPSEKRLNEFSEASLPALKRRMGVPLPYYKELELAMFTDGLKEAKEVLGDQHPFVVAMLGGKSPEEAAKAAVEGSQLSDPAVRKAIMEGGKKAMAESHDPMILLAKQLDPMGRALRKQVDEEVKAVLDEHGGRINRARFAVYGKSVHPDATFTLRLTYGPVSTYEANGTLTQPFTTFHGLFDRAAAWGPEAEGGVWALPQRWQDKKAALKLDTPYNFVHSVDIIGGNSGSAVVNKKGELVGLIFDGNIESLPGRYFYDAKANRGVSVDARGILESLNSVYEAKELAEELLSK